jgi:hypothetical protein
MTAARLSIQLGSLQIIRHGQRRKQHQSKQRSTAKGHCKGTPQFAARVCTDRRNGKYGHDDSPQQIKQMFH